LLDGGCVERSVAFLDRIGFVGIGAAETGVERGEVWVGGRGNGRDNRTGRGRFGGIGLFGRLLGFGKFRRCWRIGRLSLGTTIALKHAKSIIHFIFIRDYKMCIYI
jgi:hypothetical protein